MNKTYIIAEAGVNHNGKLPIALRLCDEACKAGADAVKFQTFITENVIIEFSEKAEYQKKTTAKNQSQFDMIKKLELNFDAFTKIKAHCDKIGIDFLSTPDDSESLDFLISIGLKTIKVGSSEITNIPYLKAIGQKKVKVLLSTGMSTLNEVKAAYDTLMNSGAGPIVILHCTSEYPCRLEEVNLKAIISLRNTFKTEVGYSDHTSGIDIAPAAVALGATLVEKHLTLDKSMSGPDHSASIEPGQFRNMVKAIRNVEKALGDGEKKPSPSEIKNILIVRRSIVASRDIREGEDFSDVNITAKRPGTGISPIYWDKIIGLKAKRFFAKDELIEI